MSSDVAHRFARHPLHASSRGPSYARCLTVVLTPKLSFADFDSIKTAIGLLPMKTLQTFSAHVDCDVMHGTSLIPELLGPVTNIRKLYLSCDLASCSGLFGRVRFPCLEYLILRTTNHMLATAQYVDFLQSALRVTSQSIRQFDLGSKELLTSPVIRRLNQGTSTSTCLAPSEEVSLLVKSVKFRNINFAIASLDWSKLVKGGLEDLRILNCIGPQHILGCVPAVAASWPCLRTLALVLPHVQMHHNPATLRVVEIILRSLPCYSLQNLSLEFPAAERLPAAECIARHGKLRSLLVAATDSDGRWIPFCLNDMRLIYQHCSSLQCLGLTLPPADLCGEFLVSGLCVNHRCYANHP